MKDIVCTLLTSEGCGHCSHFRGDGVLGNKKNFTSYDFINKHLKPNGIKKDIVFLNIHFGSMNGQHNQIAAIAKYSREKDSIKQELYYFDQGNSVVSVMTIDSKEKVKVLIKKQLVKINNKSIQWLDFLNLKVPKNIERYTFFYPCFIVFEKDDWNKKENILGIPNAGIVVKNPVGVYEIDKNGQTIQERNVPSQQLISDAFLGKIKFEPHRNNFSGEEEKKAEEVKEVKEEKKVEEVKFIIKGYDDY